MMKNSADLEFFFPLDEFPPKHIMHAFATLLRLHQHKRAAKGEIIFQKLINYLIKYPTINIFNFLPSSPRWSAPCCFGHDKNKIINMLIVQYKCISAWAI